MGEAERVAPSPAAAGLVNPVPAQRARLLLVQGDIAEAARRAKRRDLGPDDELGYPQEPEYLVLARVLLTQDHPGPGTRAAAAAACSFGDSGPGGQVIEIQALRALALAASGDLGLIP